MLLSALAVSLLFLWPVLLHVTRAGGLSALVGAL
jgi:hypothetical protein